MSAPLRGQVHWADTGFGRKPWVVISNNSRNRAIDSLLAARITTTAKHHDLPTVVPLANQDPLPGFVHCDDLEQLYREDLLDLAGALSPRTMVAVNEALKIALALP